MKSNLHLSLFQVFKNHYYEIAMYELAQTLIKITWRIPYGNYKINYLHMKRIFDVGFSLTGIFLFAPAWIIFAVLIWLEDKQDVLFRQERLGKNKNGFVIYKFRTMHNGVVTKVGKHLRKTGLDETLQFINVLRGEMSIIGPRPLTIQDVSRLGWTTDDYAIRWNIKPGISGPAQVFGAGSAAASFKMDVQYIHNNTLFKDFYFLVLSFLVNILGKSRVRKML